MVNTLKKFISIIMISLLVLTTCIGCSGSEKSITVFAGSASKPALEEAAATFEQQTGIKVYLNFGGSGTMLSQLKIAGEGDLYIPGSPDYMQKAENEGIICTESV